MAFSPCLEKSLNKAEITASLSLLREPRVRPARLPDCPGCQRLVGMCADTVLLSCKRMMALLIWQSARSQRKGRSYLTTESSIRAPTPHRRILVSPRCHNEKTLPAHAAAAFFRAAQPFAGRPLSATDGRTGREASSRDFSKDERPF